jgi:Bacterial sugar transferase
MQRSATFSSIRHLNPRETVRAGMPPADRPAPMPANPSASAWPSRQHGPLQTAEGRWGLVAKRAEDLVLGAALLLLALPLMVATAAAIRIDTPGPALFRQKRRGLNNSPFDTEVPDCVSAGVPDPLRRPTLTLPEDQNCQPIQYDGALTGVKY